MNACGRHHAAEGKELFHLEREHLAKRVMEKLAGDGLERVPPPDERLAQFAIRHRPVTLINAIWQRFAEEIAGIITVRHVSGTEVR